MSNKEPRFDLMTKAVQSGTFNDQSQNDGISVNIGSRPCENNRTLCVTHHKQTVQAVGALVCRTGSCPEWGGVAHVLPAHKHSQLVNILL